MCITCFYIVIIFPSISILLNSLSSQPTSFYFFSFPFSPPPLHSTQAQSRHVVFKCYLLLLICKLIVILHHSIPEEIDKCHRKMKIQDTTHYKQEESVSLKELLMPMVKTGAMRGKCSPKHRLFTLRFSLHLFSGFQPSLHRQHDYILMEMATYIHQLNPGATASFAMIVKKQIQTRLFSKQTAKRDKFYLQGSQVSHVEMKIPLSLSFLVSGYYGHFFSLFPGQLDAVLRYMTSHCFRCKAASAPSCWFYSNKPDTLKNSKATFQRVL